MAQDRWVSSGRLSEALQRVPLGAVRAADLDGYANAHEVLADAAAAGRLHRVARGIYLPVPPREGTDWQPTVEASAAAVGVATMRTETPLIGMSAARMHGALPRAVARAWVAAPRTHRPIAMSSGASVSFVVRRSPLDVQRVPSELGPVLVTTVEQTILDLMRGVGIHGLDGERDDVVRGLAALTDPADVLRCAAEGRGQRAAFLRFLEVLA